jgi:hypothetical protein
MRPYCPCQACQQRTRERLDNASDSSLRHMISILRAHLADKEKPCPTAPVK